jgi:hypothetical protein
MCGDIGYQDEKIYFRNRVRDCLCVCEMATLLDTLEQAQG